MNNNSGNEELEKDLWEIKEYFRAFLDNTVLGIAIMDTNHRIILVNETFATLFKRTKESFVGKMCYQEFEFRSAICPHCPGVRAIASKKTEMVETSAHLPDGTDLYVKNRAIPFFNKQGDVAGFFELVENIDQQKRMEMALRIAEENYRIQFENAVDAIFLVDAENGMIVDVNSAASDLTMRNKKELIGKHYRQINFVNADAGEALYNSSSSHVLALETEIFNIEGVSKNVLVANNILTIRDKKIIQSIFRDITEQKKVEDANRQIQASLVQSSKLATLGEMAGGIAHEINNPLAVIKGYSMVMKQLLDNPPIDISHFSALTKNILETVDRISKIILGLRSFSRDGENDEQVYVKLEAIVDKTLSFCAERFKNHGVAIDANIPSSLAVTCRETQISQVILNLLSNSFDAISELPSKWVRIDGSESDDYVEIAITDSGTGIPLAVREKLMRPFFTTKEVGKGTGLGLSISHGIMSKHNGKLIYDESCSNTRFVIKLPKNSPSSNRTEAA